MNLSPEITRSEDTNYYESKRIFQKVIWWENKLIIHIMKCFINFYLLEQFQESFDQLHLYLEIENIYISNITILLLKWDKLTIYD